MFWTRLLSGIVLLAIALATFSFGNVFLAVPLWLISLIAYRELTKALKCATDEKKFNALARRSFFIMSLSINNFHSFL